MSGAATNPAQCLHDGLISAGWEKTLASEEGAYQRHGHRYLTWRRGGVLVASSGTSKCYNADSGGVDSYMGGLVNVTIEALFVDPEMRGRGLAVQALAQWCSLASNFGVTLWVEPWPLSEGVEVGGLHRLYIRQDFRFADDSRRVMHFGVPGQD